MDFCRMETLIPATPAPHRELLKRSFTLYRASFRRVFLLALLLSLAVFAPRLIAYFIGKKFFTDLAPFSPQRLWFILIELISMLLMVGIFWHINGVLHQHKERLMADVRVGIRKVLWVFIATIIHSAIVLTVASLIYILLIFLFEYRLISIESTGTLLFSILIFFGQFLLLLYVTTLFIFLVPLIAIENKGIFPAIEKSVSLVWNHWWRVFSLQIIPWISYLALLIVLRYIFLINIHIYFVEEGNLYLPVIILHIFIFALFVPWVAAVNLLQLKDLEQRKVLTHKDEYQQSTPHPDRI
jgi:hypothetical protein